MSLGATDNQNEKGGGYYCFHDVYCFGPTIWSECCESVWVFVLLIVAEDLIAVGMRRCQAKRLETVPATDGFSNIAVHCVNSAATSYQPLAVSFH